MPSTYKNPDWPDDEVTELRRLWGEGLSAGKIATAMGKTRNAVIGKARRLKLAARAPRTAPPKPRKEKPVIAAKPTSQRTRHIAPPGAGTKSKGFMIGRGPSANEAKPLPLRADYFKPLPGSSPVCLIDLREKRCKWPVGENPAIFCNCEAEQIPGPKGGTITKPYCATHARMSLARISGAPHNG